MMQLLLTRGLRGMGSQAGPTPSLSVDGFIPFPSGPNSDATSSLALCQIFNPKVIFCSQMWPLVYASCVPGPQLGLGEPIFPSGTGSFGRAETPPYSSLSPLQGPQEVNDLLK